MLTIKGVPLAVKAIRLLRQRGIEMRLVLAGTPDPYSPTSIETSTLTQWSEEPGIVWLGHVEDVRRVWAQAHIAVLPSLGGEGIPKSLLEAAACGRPIIASDVPGCREIVRPGVNGELIAAGDAEALAEALATLALNPERRRRYAAASRQLVKSGLSNEAVGQSDCRNLSRVDHGTTCFSLVPRQLPQAPGSNCGRSEVRWCCPRSDGHLGGSLAHLNSRGERIRSPECGWLSL